MERKNYCFFTYGIFEFWVFFIFFGNGIFKSGYNFLKKVGREKIIYYQTSNVPSTKIVQGPIIHEHVQ